MATSTRLLLDLPNELIGEILKNVPDLHSVHAASQTCTRIFNIYQASQLQSTILRSSMLRISDRQSKSKIYDLLRNLQFVITQKMVQRDVARSVLQDGWKLFAKEEYEQLLIPYGKALAQSYVSDGRKLDAIHLLQTMWDQREPFILEKPQDTCLGRPSTLLPVKMLLDQLCPTHDSHSPTTAELQQFQGVPIAKIGPGEIEWDTARSQLNEFQQLQIMKNGILFEKGCIRIKFSPIFPALEAEPPMSVPTVYRLNASSDRALIESLDDELVTKLRNYTWWSTDSRPSFGG